MLLPLELMQDARVFKALVDILRRNPAVADSARAGRAARPATAWHAVSILAGSAACEGARDCGSRRFLSADAPRLPLPGCGRACECRYRHHPDRRGAPRRGIDRAHIARPHAGAEQRVIPRGRRDEDA